MVQAWHLNPWANASALTGSAGLTSRKNCACSLRVQVPGVPSGELNQPQCEEKSWQARRPHTRILRMGEGRGGRRGGRREEGTFSIALALEALDPAWNGQVTLDVSSWSAGPSLLVAAPCSSTSLPNSTRHSQLTGSKINTSTSNRNTRRKLRLQTAVRPHTRIIHQSQ